MATGKNTKFDLDLEYGQIREKRVADLLKGSKVEIKTERAWWRKTGNIAIEYTSCSRPHHASHRRVALRSWSTQ